MSSLGLSFVRFSELTSKAPETRLKDTLGHDIILPKCQRVEHTRRVQEKHRMHKESTEFTRKVPNVQGKHRKRSCVGPDLSPTQQFPHKGENSPPPHLLIPTHAPATPLFPSPKRIFLVLSISPTHHSIYSSTTAPRPLRSFPHPNGSSSSSALPLPSAQIARPRPPLPPLFPRPTKNEAGHS